MTRWCRVILGDVTRVRRGTSYSSRDLGGDTTNPILIGMGEMVAGGGLDLRAARRFNGRIKADQLVKPTDVILAMTDLTQDGRLLGSAAQLSSHNLTDCYLVSHHLQLVQTSEAILPPFLRLLLSTPEWYAHVQGVATGTTVRAVSVEDAKRFSFALPPLEYQQKIVDLLSPIFDRLESNQRLGLLIENEFRVTFDLEFSVAPVDFGVSLTDVIDINPRRRFPTNVTKASFLPMAYVPTDSAVVSSWETRSIGSGQKFTNGDVVLARITPCLENGKAAVIDFLAEGQVGFGSTELLVFAGRDEPLTEWLYCLVRSEPFRKFAIRHMTGTSGRQRCPASAFSGYRLKSLDPKQVRSFCERFSKNFKMLGQLRRENRALRAEINALLPGLIRGTMEISE